MKLSQIFLIGRTAGLRALAVLTGGPAFAAIELSSGEPESIAMTHYDGVIERFIRKQPRPEAFCGSCH